MKKGVEFMSNSKIQIKPYYLLFTVTFLFAIICIVLSKVNPMYWNLETIFKSMMNNRGLYFKYLIPITISFILTIISIIYGTRILVNQIKQSLHDEYYIKEYSIKELIVLGIMTLLLAIYLVYVAWYLFLLVAIILLVMWWIANDN